MVARGGGVLSKMDEGEWETQPSRFGIKGNGTGNSQWYCSTVSSFVW